jgi:probable phosphoglycerate mutase
MLKIYLARHGQNEDNAQGILNGHRDKPLTALGFEQAKFLARHIKNVGLVFNKVYSSPLSRAYDTAYEITKILNLPDPEILPLLIERDFGVMSGEKLSDIEKLCAPDIIKTDTLCYFLNPEGAETFPELLIRANKLLDQIKVRHQDGNILLVGHGDFGKMIYAAYYKLDWREVLRLFHFGNTELIILSADTTSDEVHVFATKQFNN